MFTLAFIEGLFSPTHLLILGIILLLIFGRRLPEVGRNLGRGIVEFKKGLKGIDDEVEMRSNQPSPRQDGHELEQNPYRPPLTDSAGSDRRVSRADEVAAAPRDTHAGQA